MSEIHAARLAAIHYDRGFEIDALLLGICDELRSRDLQIGGIIQSALGKRGQCAASVLVTDLRSGKAFDIWDARGPCARGCRLDESGLLDAEPALTAAIADGVDLLVINRFGRAESVGRGLIASFTAALEAGIPILTAVRPPYEEAWAHFHGGLGRLLPTDGDALLEWCLWHAQPLALGSQRMAISASQ